MCNDPNDVFLNKQLKEVEQRCKCSVKEFNTELHDILDAHYMIGNCNYE